METITNFLEEPSAYSTTSTPRLVGDEALTLITVLRDSIIGDWRLVDSLVGQVQRGPNKVLATTWLEGLVEYGEGRTDAEAIEDLVVSLGEYRESLEQREARLEESAAIDLKCLRRIVERPVSGSARGQG